MIIQELEINILQFVKLLIYFLINSPIKIKLFHSCIQLEKIQ
ncbi:hypothetical protein pb186bvf_007651 [Paramecium bursaria]